MTERISEARLRAIESEDWDWGLVRELVPEIRRYRALCEWLAFYPEPNPPGLERVNPSAEGNCVFCGGDTEPISGPPVHKAHCPWPELEDEAEAIREERKGRTWESTAYPALTPEQVAASGFPTQRGRESLLVPDPEDEPDFNPAEHPKCPRCGRKMRAVDHGPNAMDEPDWHWACVKGCPPEPSRD